jgi:hypothetical protein
MIRTLIILSILSAFAVPISATAADSPATAPANLKRAAPPPPGIDEKGVEPATAAATDDDDTLEPTMPDTRLVRDKASRDKDQTAAQIRASSDSITQRKEGNDTVEEYREKGRLRMIRIIPPNGPEQIYMDTNGDGRLNRDPRDGPVSPVYFTIYQWN